MKTSKLVAITFCLYLGQSAAFAQLKTLGKPSGVDSEQITATVAKLLEQGHYSHQKIDNVMARKILETYLQNLDYNKLFFTQADIDNIRAKYGPTLDQDIIAGKVDAARDIYALFKQRVQDRIAKVHQLLKKDYTFKSNRTVALDRRKEPWAANAEEADSLWRDRIEGELLQEKISKVGTEPAATTVGKRYDQLLRSLNERDDKDVAQLFVNAMALTYDPHSEYLGKSELESFEIQMRLSLTGIGAELQSEDGYAKVSRLIQGGPAQLSNKVNVGDKIAGVGQGKDNFVETLDMKLDKVVEMIRGKKGSTVRLLVIPVNDPAKRKVVELVRADVKLTEQEAKADLIERNQPDGSVQKIGWITLPSFYQDMDKARTGKSTSRDVSALLKRLEQEGIQGLVIDLRRDGGGSLDEAIKMVGLFITQGAVVQVKDSGGDIDVLKDRDPGVAYNGPMIVLVNKLSASASEIFAAAMQDYGRALIVGDSSTFGKGTVQTMLELNRVMPLLSPSGNDAGALKLTVQKFYRVAGGSTQLRGVLSDIVLPSLTDTSEFGESALDHPLPYDEVEPAQIDLAANRRPLFVEDLRRRSTTRVNQDTQFQDIVQASKQMNQRLKENRISLNEKVRHDDEAKDKAARQKEQADARKIAAADHDKEFELTLANLGNPLKPVTLPPQASASPKADKASKSAPSDPALQALDEDEATSGSDQLDAIKRETINIASDLIDSTRAPRTAGR